MELELGIVCGHCDTYSPMRTATCPACGTDLAILREQATRRAVTPPPAAIMFEQKLQPRRMTPGATAAVQGSAQRAGAPVSSPGPPAATTLSLEELMDQAKNF